MIKQIAMNLVAGLALLGAGLAWSPTAEARRGCDSCGSVERVEQVWVTDKHVGGGTVLGAIIGGAIGSQVGGGDGRKAATVAGAVAGGVVGHNTEKNRRDRVLGYRIRVHMDNGGYRTVEQRENYHFYRGDRVRVSNGRAKPL